MTAAAPAGTGANTGRCAVVDCSGENGDGSLTAVYLLQRLGFAVEVLASLRERWRNPFVYAGRHRPNVRYYRSCDRALAAACRDRFDLVVINSFENPAALDCAAKLLLDTPVLGLVADGRHPAQSPNYQLHLSHPHCRLMSLAPDTDPDATAAPVHTGGTLHPVFFFDRDVGTLPRLTERRRICVQGDFAQPHEFGELLHALRALKAEGRADFECHVTGRDFSRGFRDFARAVRASGLDSRVRYVRKGRGCRACYRLLNSLDFMLPLTDADSRALDPRCSPTASLTVAIGFNLIPLASAALVRRYGLGDVAFTRDADLLSVLRAALDAPAEDLALRRARLARVRQRLLEDSARDLARVIEQVSVERGPALRPPDLRPVESLAG